MVNTPPIEHGTDSMGQPIIQLGPPIRINEKFNAEADLRERHGAHMQQIERLHRTNATTLASAMGRRNSDRILVSSSQPVTG